MLPQSIFAPIIASMADTFQMRKSLIVIFAMVSFVGAAIAPGSTHIGRLIAAQVLVGFGFVVMPLAQVIPSEILPRKWRPSMSPPPQLASLPPLRKASMNEWPWMMARSK